MRAIYCNRLLALQIICIALVLSAVIALFRPVCVSAAPVQVGTSTSANATLGHSARKSFYDSLNSMHWAFWYNGSSISYARSATGGTWTDVGTLSYNTSNFTVTFKEVSGASYVVFSAFSNDYDIVVRRGVLSNTAIAFDSEVVVFDGTRSDDRYTQPHSFLQKNE